MIQFRLNALTIAALTALATAGSAMAAGVVANGGQTQVNTVGNTPVVNIAGANASGISRNTFSNFDVDKNGVVLNNLTAAGTSKLAGQLAANANLNGNAAKVIVADVTSAQASKLNGAMEVAGAPAHLLIANAAGISANGATTINAPMLTLAAAGFSPRADSPLALNVDTTRATPATIQIDGAGVDVGAGQVNLLSRATIVNGAVKGWSINSQNGTQFDGDANGNFTGKLVNTSAAEGAKPAVALDVSALGGMYADKIVLEGSEYGLGVNNAGLISGGQGGVVSQMFGSDITNAPNGLVTTGNTGLVLSVVDHSAPYALTGDSQMQWAKDNFQQMKKSTKNAMDSMNASRGWTPEAQARLSDSDKLVRLADQETRSRAEFAELPATNAADAAAKAEAQAAADAQRKAAEEQARIEQEARDRAQQQADAEREAAEQQARAEREAKEAQARAEYEARIEQEARDRAQQQAAEQEARDRAQEQARAEYEARMEQEAKARAEYEARMEQEAKARAEYEARMQQEARERAEQQAADQAARDRAQEQARAEYEARMEQEARDRAQQQANEQKARADYDAYMQEQARQRAEQQAAAQQAAEQNAGADYEAFLAQQAAQQKALAEYAARLQDQAGQRSEQQQAADKAQLEQITRNLAAQSAAQAAQFAAPQPVQGVAVNYSAQPGQWNVQPTMKSGYTF
ncbi:filamentous hemagglutinin N-terminal domain-containing protein [Paraburkholderia sp. BCC1886]|uniref:filamentous hemagglutinin N-terminal domain-containing protein n=1 Tax=Paraburkholderia sp. BCC1886 TaxID=2562670 RepID=UPI0011825BCD|nr:filamentous hemagglutinin N-terminal domain-containing protein [Paraburkholderia sp. BCC1886]